MAQVFGNDFYKMGINHSLQHIAKHSLPMELFCLAHPRGGGGAMQLTLIDVREAVR